MNKNLALSILLAAAVAPAHAINNSGKGINLPAPVVIKAPLGGAASLPGPKLPGTISGPASLPGVAIPSVNAPVIRVGDTLKQTGLDDDNLGPVFAELPKGPRSPIRPAAMALEIPQRDAEPTQKQLEVIGRMINRIFGENIGLDKTARSEKIPELALTY